LICQRIKVYLTLFVHDKLFFTIYHPNKQGAYLLLNIFYHKSFNCTAHPFATDFYGWTLTKMSFVHQHPLGIYFTRLLLRLVFLHLCIFRYGPRIQELVKSELIEWWTHWITNSPDYELVKWTKSVKRGVR